MTTEAENSSRAYISKTPIGVNMNVNLKKLGTILLLLGFVGITPSVVCGEWDYESETTQSSILQTSVTLSEPTPAVADPISVSETDSVSLPETAPVAAVADNVPAAADVPASAENIVTKAEKEPQTGSSVLQAPQDELTDLKNRLKDIENQLKKEKQKADDKKAADAKKPSVKVSGRIHMDSDWFDQDDASKARVGDMRDGAELRRAWLGVSGNLNQFRYKCDIDFAPSTIAFKDAYVGVDSLPILCDFRAGYYKEAIGVDQLVGVHQMWFIDRPVCMDGVKKYEENRSLGLSIRNSSRKENFLWNFGFYQSCNDTLRKHYDEYSPDDSKNLSGVGFTGRIANLFYENNCTGTNLHLGMAVSYKAWDPREKMNWGARPEGYLGNTVVGTGDFIGTTDTLMLAPEFIWTHNSFAIQAEYQYTKLKNKDYNDPEFQGGYIAVAYFLTGEHFTYAKGEGILTSITPRNDFCRICKGGQFFSGPGAWELLYRFSWIDYSQMPLLTGADGDKSKIGICYDHTFGINWYLSQNTRFMVNYILSNNQYTYGTANTDGNVHVTTMSFQMYF